MPSIATYLSSNQYKSEIQSSLWYETLNDIFLSSFLYKFIYSNYAKVLYRLMKLHVTPEVSLEKCIHLYSNTDMANKEYASWGHIHE